MNPRAIIAGSFAITLGVIVYSEIRTCKEAPWPPRIIGTGIVFGMIDLLSMVNDDLASVFAIGFVLAAIVGKLFVKPSCTHTCATAQPASYKSLDQSTPGQQGQTLA